MMFRKQKKSKKTKRELKPLINTSNNINSEKPDLLTLLNDIKSNVMTDRLKQYFKNHKNAVVHIDENTRKKLKKDKDNFSVYSKDHLLFIAVRNHKNDIVKDMKDRFVSHFDINILSSGLNILKEAFEYDNTTAFTYLVDAFKKNNIELSKIVNEHVFSNQSPMLHMAVVKGNLVMIDTLIACGANINSIGQDGLNVLYVAAKINKGNKCFKEVFDRLIHYGADPTLTATLSLVYYNNSRLRLDEFTLRYWFFQNFDNPQCSLNLEEKYQRIDFIKQHMEKYKQNKINSNVLELKKEISELKQQNVLINKQLQQVLKSLDKINNPLGQTGNKQSPSTLFFN